jgi:hypothetical protein
MKDNKLLDNKLLDNKFLDNKIESKYMTENRVDNR